MSHPIRRAFAAIACGVVGHEAGVERYLDAGHPIGMYRPVALECPRCRALLGSHIALDVEHPDYRRVAAAHARLGLEMRSR